MSESRFVLRTDTYVAPPVWRTVSFSCPRDLVDEMDRFAEQAGWSRGKFLYHLMNTILPNLTLEIPDLFSHEESPEFSSASLPHAQYAASSVAVSDNT